MATQTEYEILDDESIEDALEKLHDWQRDEKTIHRTCEFGSFLEAIAFVNRVAVVAEGMDHHPDIAINYKKVTLRCWTHKTNAITRADIELARNIDKIV